MNKNARYQAWTILVQVFKKQVFANLLLNKIARQEKDLKTKNLVFALVHGTITQKIYLEYLANKLIDQQKTPIEIQVLIWMSFYQAFFLKKIPNYAIVNEAVQLAKKINPKFAGLVNASLKKAFRDSNFLAVNLIDEEEKFCVENAFPQTLYKKIKIDFGLEIAKKIVKDSLNKPSLSIRINSLKISTNDFYQKYSQSLKLEKNDITKNGMITQVPPYETTAYKEGLITAQDQASILVSEVLNPKPNTRVLDMCSAPGGKLTHLSALMNNTGSIVAYEIKTNKISLIKSNLERMGVKNVMLINDDALTINDSQQFDNILLDAPCSGFGVLKRKPEIKLKYNSKNEGELIKLQQKLLAVAYKNLKVNGFLTYSTCTINLQENAQQILKFVQEYPKMKIVFEKQIFGFENNTDGFYICKLQKLG